MASPRRAPSPRRSPRTEPVRLCCRCHRTMREASSAALALLVSGADASEVLSDAMAELQPDGFLGSLRLSQQLSPLPLSLLGRLETLVENGTYVGGQAPEHTQPSVLIGEDECEIVFRKDISQDRFQFPVFFRLTDPALSEPTLGYRATQGHAGGGLPPLPVCRALFAGRSPGRHHQELELHLAEHVPIDRPLSVDTFRDGLARVTPGWWNGVPIASSGSRAGVRRPNGAALDAPRSRPR